MTTITPFHKNVFTRIRLWLQKYLSSGPFYSVDSVDLELKTEFLCNNLYLKPDDVLEAKVVAITRDLLDLCKLYKEDQKRVLIFAIFFLHRNIETALRKTADKRLLELIKMGELPESMGKLYDDPTCTLTECLPDIYPTAI